MGWSHSMFFLSQKKGKIMKTSLIGVLFVSVFLLGGSSHSGEGGVDDPNNPDGSVSSNPDGSDNPDYNPPEGEYIFFTPQSNITAKVYKEAHPGQNDWGMLYFYDGSISIPLDPGKYHVAIFDSNGVSISFVVNGSAGVYTTLVGVSRGAEFTDGLYSVVFDNSGYPIPTFKLEVHGGTQEYPVRGNFIPRFRTGWTGLGELMSDSFVRSVLDASGVLDLSSELPNGREVNNNTLLSVGDVLKKGDSSIIVVGLEYRLHSVNKAFVRGSDVFDLSGVEVDQVQEVEMDDLIGWQLIDCIYQSGQTCSN